MRGINRKDKDYVIYDKNEFPVFVGNKEGCLKFTGYGEDNFKTILYQCRKNKKSKYSYDIYEIK